MLDRSTLLAALAAVTCVVAVPAAQAATSAPIYGFAMKRLDGTPAKLSSYKGEVMLIVNTASKCGYTPQYDGLEKLYKAYHPRGLAVLGFPANDFFYQEPGNSKEISTFCTQNYGVTFDMFEKIVVKGNGQAPLYKYLTSPKTDPKFAGDIGWNFTKFVVNREGQVVARFKSDVTPADPALVKAIETALGQK